MSHFLKIGATIIIITACYIGVRYLGAVIHYVCANPVEDCPPPIYGAGQIAWFMTGGSLVPFWTRE